MNRPLALIQGALALPNSRPLSGLPPPFGSWQRSASRTEQLGPQAAVPESPRYAPKLRPRFKAPPKNKLILFYKLPQRPASDSRFDEQLAEARRYLEADHAQPHSSRADRMLGAAIFVGCSIALAWLLATCSSHELADKATVSARPSESMVHSGRGTQQTSQTVMEQASAPHKLAPPALAAAEPLPRVIRPADAARSSQQDGLQASASARSHSVSEKRIAGAHRPLAVTAPTRVASANTRIASSRLNDSRAPLATHSGREWAAAQSSANDTAERKALWDWAAQQRHASAVTRTTVSTSGNVDWNAHMTQRRITDNPAAFQSGRASQ
ncbi:hypothetical protein JNC05_10010 [Paraburkholderia ginsengiterrae]|nr:hypothetical protein [Paraburkholderia ginsengiterrae]